MPESPTTARIVLTTTGSAEEARRIGRALVKECLIACASIVPAVESIYRWKGEIESGSETMMILKTNLERVAALQARLRELHSYEMPEFLVLSVESGSAAYLDWLAACLARGESPGQSQPERKDCV